MKFERFIDHFLDQFPEFKDKRWDLEKFVNYYDDKYGGLGELDKDDLDNISIVSARLSEPELYHLDVKIGNKVVNLI